MKKVADPLRLDPTRTTDIRKRFTAEVKRRFVKLAKSVREGVAALNEGALALSLTANAGGVDPKRLRQFQTWLSRQIDRNVLTPAQLGEDIWTQAYAAETYRRAHVQAYDKVRKRGQSKVSKILHEGGKGEFLRTLGAPASMDKVKYLASRTYEDLDGVTKRMAVQMSRTMGDGMLKGLSADEIADNLVEDVGLEQTRAETIARTEIVRAHAEGTLDAFEKLGVSAVGVDIEWTTAGDNRVCPKCAALQGVAIPVEAAHGLLPRHPNCRCSWIPSFDGEGITGEGARQAFQESADEGDDGWLGADFLEDED